MNLLELFSGTKSIEKVAKTMGYNVISLDRDMPADIQEDIMTWNYKIYPPGYFDVITASPVCLFWSRLRKCALGREIKAHPGVKFSRELLEEDIEKYGKPMVDKVKEIIDYFKPKFFWIENPQTGRMKDYITDLPYFDVDYCMYSDWGYKKCTRFWTNIVGFEPKTCNKKCGNMYKNRHIRSTGGGAAYLDTKSGEIVHTTKRAKFTDKRFIKVKHKGTTKYDRYRIPPKLIEELLKLCV